MTYKFLAVFDWSFPVIMTVRKQWRRGGYKFDHRTETSLAPCLFVSTDYVKYCILHYQFHTSIIWIHDWSISSFFFTNSHLSIIIHVSAQLKILYAELKNVRQNEIFTSNIGNKHQIADDTTTDRSGQFGGNRKVKKCVGKIDKE